MGGTITENIAGPHLSISVSSVYPSCIYFLSIYVSLLCVSLIYFSASLSIQPLSIVLISPFISPVYQSSIYSSSIYLLSLFPSVSSSIHSPILPFHSSIHLGILSVIHIYPFICLLYLCLSSISLPLYPLIHPSILHMYPFVCPIHHIHQSSVSLCTYLPINLSLSSYLVIHPFFHSTYVSYLCIICIYLSLSHLCICMFSPLFQVSTQT